VIGVEFGVHTQSGGCPFLSGFGDVPVGYILLAPRQFAPRGF